MIPKGDCGPMCVNPFPDLTFSSEWAGNAKGSELVPLFINPVDITGFTGWVLQCHGGVQICKYKTKF